MRIWPKLTGQITLGLGILSFCGMICRIFAYEYFRPRTINYVQPGQHDGILSVIIAVSLVLMFAFHLAALLTTVYYTQLFGDRNNVRKWTLACGIISFMSIFVTIGCLSDIGKEAPMGWGVTGEWRVVYLSLIPQALIHGLVLVTVFSGLRYLKKGHGSHRNARDETVFYAVHYGQR